MTYCLEGSCSIQLSYETIETKMSNGECLYIQHYSSFFVGVAGFEPTTSTSQMWRDTGLRYTPNFAFDFLPEGCRSIAMQT